jgi:hypothetical protein
VFSLHHSIQELTHRVHAPSKRTSFSLVVLVTLLAAAVVVWFMAGADGYVDYGPALAR